MNSLKIIGTGIIFAACVACGTSRKQEKVLMPEVTVQASRKPVSDAYVPTAEMAIAMKHLRLEVSFDYSQQRVFGKATLQLQPHFYPQQVAMLNARQFTINRVALIQHQDTIPLSFTYDSSVITIQLNRSYRATEIFTLYLDYVAHPNRITDKGNQAISDAKGLYFINPKKEIPGKPRQIWTQGEPESNSGWFPLIDKPNQKITQELFITVDATDKTLSNGELIWSKENENGTRTDYWKQDLPHAPYLVMMAIGEFTITTDYWRDSVEVSYYLEKDYERYARLIFGKTPEMMECFSQKLGVPYPWSKYSQVVVRDFVSGAMENTTAVIHYSGVQHDYREHLENTHEDIIAHELFHHWFGDLVTCESWNNISVNESFATYGEYIWNECAYGKDVADYEFKSNLNAYLAQRKKHDAELYRRHYGSPNDVFDVVSYQKGSRILHLLRYELGDDAFFAVLKTYLKTYAFGTAEVHQLRLIAEQVTGKDLTPFFNQWYFNAGHPDLVISHIPYNPNEIQLNIEQKQDTLAYGLFTLPVTVDVVTQSGISRQILTVREASHSFTLRANEPILTVMVDAEDLLVANKEETKPPAMWTHQLMHSPRCITKLTAMNALTNLYTPDSAAQALQQPWLALLSDTFYLSRQIALSSIYELEVNPGIEILNRIQQLASVDWNASNRYLATAILGELDAKTYTSLFQQGMSDSSYSVMSASFGYLYTTDSIKAATYAPIIEANDNPRVVRTLSSIYEKSVSPTHHAYFKQKTKATSKTWYYAVRSYGNYLLNQSPEIQLDGVRHLNEQRVGNLYYSYLTQSFYAALKKQAEQSKNSTQLALKKTKKGSAEESVLQKRLQTVTELIGLL